MSNKAKFKNTDEHPKKLFRYDYWSNPIQQQPTGLLFYLDFIESIEIEKYKALELERSKNPRNNFRMLDSKYSIYWAMEPLLITKTIKIKE
jgi:hypothetical protein